MAQQPPPRPSPRTGREKCRPAIEVVLVPDGGELTLREAVPPWEIAALMPAIRARLGLATGTEAGATRDRDAGAGI